MNRLDFRSLRKVGLSMRTREVLHYDAFTSKQHMGNPAGVVLQADDLDEESMRSIAKSVGFNETVFVLKSNRSDFRLKHFTPGHEMNLCGHATICSMYSLKTLGIIEESCHEVTIETKRRCITNHI